MSERDAATPALIVTSSAREMCRALGVTAVVVLQDVTLDAETDPAETIVAETNVRRIAANLGISKDTAARALARLADAGLLIRSARRRDTSGTFASSTYELHLGPDAGVALVAQAPGPASPCPVATDMVGGPTAGRRTSPAADPGPSGEPPSSQAERPDRGAAPSRRGRRPSRIDQRALFDVASEGRGRR